MNEVAYARKQGVFDRLLARMGIAPGAGVSFLENPTEEIDRAIERTGKLPKLHGMPGGAVARVEENYLYSTRRFPNNTANNTIGSGAVTAGDYAFFTSGGGDPATAAGYFSVGNLTYQQTNMASSGKIPTGRGFRMFDLAVSFNSLAKGADIGQLMDVCNLRFEKQGGQLVIQHGPVSLWPGGSGIAGFAGVATTASTTTINVQAASNGLPALTNVRRFKNPRELKQNESFVYYVNAAANIPTQNTAVALSDFVEMRIWLYGQVIDAIPA